MNFLSAESDRRQNERDAEEILGEGKDKMAREGQHTQNHVFSCEPSRRLWLAAGNSCRFGTRNISNSPHFTVFVFLLYFR